MTRGSPVLDLKRHLVGATPEKLARALCSAALSLYDRAPEACPLLARFLPSKKVTSDSTDRYRRLPSGVGASSAMCTSV